ncbi:hypothetical protein MJH12_05005 [bacterium]|nr:hypothetical protein [bacterium]
MNALRKEIQQKTVNKTTVVSKKAILSLSKDSKKETMVKKHQHNEVQNQKIRVLTEQVGGLMKTLSVYKNIEKKSHEQGVMLVEQQKMISNLEIRLLEFSKEMYSHKLENDQKMHHINTQVKENTFKTTFAGLWETMSQMFFGR